jgi:hypothetical protein
MNNMGGLNKLFLIDADDFVSLDPGTDNLYTLTLDEEADVNEIEFTQDTGRISESEEDTDNGLIFKYEASVKVPKCGPGNSTTFQQLRIKKLMILGEDNNGSWWLTGYPGSYFGISIDSDTGASSQDLNSMTIKITAALPIPSLFINPLT